MQQVLIALGGNLPLEGEAPDRVLARAIAALQARGLSGAMVSSFYQTPCFPAGAGPDYVNAALCLETDLPPEALLQILHEVESDFGRKRTSRWAGRTLDLDLLAVGEKLRPDVATQQYWRELSPERQQQEAPEQLILPHPRLQDRAFVLVPLAEVAPGWKHPLLGKTVLQMRDELPAEQLAEVIRL